MNGYVKSYLTFLAFMAVTRIVVAPLTKNIPVLSDIVG
jgi:hypothetical protein